MTATNSERRKLHEAAAITDAMRITTYECFAPTSPDVHLSRDWVTIGAPGATTAVRVKGTREQRIALLSRWAEIEGCDLYIGEPLAELVDTGAAAYYGGPSGLRTGD